MTLRLMVSLVTLGLVAATAPVEAQTVSAQVTVNVPVNLSQFGPDVAKGRVRCTMSGNAITEGTGTGNHYVTKDQEFPISGGQATTTVTLLFSFTALNNPVGTTATVTCSLEGWSTSQQSWNGFFQNSPNPSFKVSGNEPLSIQQAFVW